MDQKDDENKLNFEDEQNASNSFNIIRKEYLSNLYKRISYLLLISAFILIYYIVLFPRYIASDSGTGITRLNPLSYTLTISWIIISIGIFLSSHLIKIVLLRITPSLKKYLYQEIRNLDFNIYKSHKSWWIFIILNSISITLSFLKEGDIIRSNIASLNLIFKWFVLTCLIIAIIIPILGLFFLDGLIVKIKKKSKISINLHYGKDSQLIAIYLISNRIAPRFNRDKKKLYLSISSERWLLRKKKTLLSWLDLNLFLRFREFSTPLNFQRKFLNIVLALYEWDLNQEKYK